VVLRQLKMVTQQNFFIHDMDKAVDCITSSCHQSASPCVVPPHWCSSPPTPNLKLWVISFTAKVIKWGWQFILTLLNAQRALWHSPQHPDERVHWHPTTGGPLTVIWTDTDPCFMTPDSSSVLHKLRIVFVIRKVKNQNKNPVAELERELFQQDP